MFIHDKNSYKVDTEKIYLNIIKAIYDKPTANTKLNNEKLKAFPKIKNKTMMPTLTTFIQHSIESPSQSNKARIRNNGCLGGSAS